jgi:hypothetical protein
VVASAKSTFTYFSLYRTRQADRAPEAAPEALAHGLAQSFDSAEATQRLATLTGASAVPPADTPQTTTQVLRAITPAEPRRWRRRDWLLVAAAALGGVVVAGALVRRAKRS